MTQLDIVDEHMMCRSIAGQLLGHSRVTGQESTSSVRLKPECWSVAEAVAGSKQSYLPDTLQHLYLLLL